MTNTQATAERLRPQETSPASWEKGRKVLGKLGKVLALGAIPLALVGGDIYSGGVISSALGALLGGISKIDWGGLLQNPVEKIAAVPDQLGQVAQEVRMTAEANLNPTLENFQTVASNPAEALKNITSGQGLTKDGGQDSSGPL